MDLTPVLAEAIGWPFAASLAAVSVRGGLLARRRSALNECLHELRRPLQVLALAGGGRPEVAESSLQLALAALDRLDREVNGAPALPASAAAVCPEALARAAATRWGRPLELLGGSLEARCLAAGAVLRGDPVALAQALDNLVVNAIEHGGSRVRVEARREAGAIALAVVDSGVTVAGAGPSARRRQAPTTWIAGARRSLARLAGGHRRGHGLRVVRRVAAEHGGEFALRVSPAGGEARLRLPLADGAVER